MNDINVCGNHEALIGYLYDECEPAERESIAAHVAQCALCTDEIQALRDTRAHLDAWTPPALSLGFQITRTEGDAPAEAARVLRPAAWWRRPLPAWAQVAAAAVIFAAGMSVNSVRSAEDAAPARTIAQTPAAQPAPVSTSTDDLAVTRAEFARLEQRLRSVENANVQLASRTGAGIDQDELFARLTALEDRVSENDRGNLGRFASLIRAYESNRRDLDASREAAQRVSQMELELEDHRQVLKSAVVPLAVRTSFTGGR